MSALTVSKKLKALARQIEEASEELRADAQSDESLFDFVNLAVAKAICTIDEASNGIVSSSSGEVTPENLEEMARIADAWDESGDELLSKQAHVLDEILFALSSPKNVMAQVQERQNKKIEELRQKGRTETRVKDYEEPQKRLNDMYKTEQIADAVKKNVKDFRPLQAPLQTRSCPDHSGTAMRRVSDRAYQCSLDGHIYNYEMGYTTEKGETVPGSSVENQIPDWGAVNPGHTIFNTREDILRGS